MGHFHHAALLNMQRKDLAIGLPHIESELPDCNSCQYGKQTRLPFQQITWRATKKLQLVHTDLCGPQRTPLNGSKYYIAFIDDFTRVCWIYFLRFKSKVLGVFFKFKQWIEKQSGCKIQALRSDNGKEYTSNEFNKFCEDAGLEHQLTAPYSPQKNGVSERKNRTIMEMSRCMLYEKNLPKEYWAEAANTTVFLLNRLPTKAVNGKTPYEACLISKGYRVFQANYSQRPIDLNQDELIDDPAVRGTRPLTDIYQRCNVVVLEPAGYSEAEKDPQRLDAMQKELSMIEKNQTCELVERPEHQKVICDGLNPGVRS
ncbi:hypothetical protein AgCh_035470 [Apium graveolens]